MSHCSVDSSIAGIVSIDDNVEPAACTPLLMKRNEKNSTSEVLEENCSAFNPRTTKTGILHNIQETDEALNLQNYHKCFHPFMDTSGNTTSILKGLSYLALLGIVVGILMPKNNDLPSPWYRYLSSIVGYTYFIFWCSSFYPQVLSNYERKSTEGLSVDFSISNFLGYICYGTYTSLLYWNKDIQHMYQERHGFSIGDGDGMESPIDAKITVQSNDVAFALHAVLFSAIWIYQMFIYGGLKWERGQFPISRIFVVFICLILSSIALYAYLIVKGDTIRNPWMPSWAMAHLNWLDFLYFLSFVKVSITLSKYIPQVALNARRRSCAGWNVWNVVLDFAGAILSFGQLVGDAIDLNDYSSITGNVAKLGLSIISIGFDITFFLQHYVWYPEDDNHLLKIELELMKHKDVGQDII